MKTKLFKTLAATAMSVLAIACAKEPVAGVAGDGETTEVSFDVNVPEVTAVTKGISDASTTNELICQVFFNDGNYTPIPSLNQTVPVDVTTHKATVNFSLVKGNKYAFVFWAQAEGTGYYDTEDLRSVKMNIDNVKANDPKMDAFWATATLIATSAPTSEHITLYRALAQVNFGTIMPEREDALNVKSSAVNLTSVPDTFHPFFGNKSTACEGKVDIKFQNNTAIADEKLTVNGVDYSYMATAYVFAPKSASLITDASTTVTLDNGRTTTVKAPNAPIQRNYRTNILGNLLLVDAEWNITIDSAFKGGDLFYDPVGEAIEKGGEVTLEDDFSVVPESYGLVIKKGVSTILNLNGKKLENRNRNTNNKAALQVRGTLTINGNGDVICEGGGDNNAILVEDGGHLIINGGTYYVEKDANGKSNSTIYARKACTIEINGGTFSAEPDAEGKTPYVLNQADDLTVKCFSVKGGKFKGFDPGNVNEGTITSFLAEGYKSTKVGDYYVVTKEDVTPVANNAGLNTAISGEGTSKDTPITVELTSNTIVTLDNGIANEGKNSRNVTFVGDGTQTVDVITKATSAEGGMLNYQRGSSFTFKNMTIQAGDGSFDGIVCDALTYENCTIKGKLTLYGKATFVNCVFENTMANQYCIWTWGGTDVKFDGCTFNTNGKAILLYGQATEAKPTNLMVVNSIFNDRNNGSAGKAAIEIGNDYNAYYKLTIDGCTVNGFADGKNTGSKLWANKDRMDAAHLSVTIDGTPVL